jgi:Predicted GTPase
MTPTKKQPLFIITGASGVGKSTTCEILFQSESKYIVMESDLLWNEIYNTPETNYNDYRKLWLQVCANISQIGKPVVLCGCAVPEQFEACEERELFTEIHYLAVVCGDNKLESRMRNGRSITDESWITGSKEFNRWLKENVGANNITLLDTTELSPKQASEIADNWIIKHIK